MQEHAHVLGQNKPTTNASYGNTYNPNWRNHPNLSWKLKPLAYASQGAQQQFSSTSAQQQQPPPSSTIEQAILNLSKVVGTFTEEQKVLNVQTNQKIEIVESSLNKNIDSMHSEISNKYNNLQVPFPGCLTSSRVLKKGNSLPIHKKTRGECMR